MYYLKYRPQTIKELDSKSVRDQLAAVLQADPMPHAFLFSGPKGTGKTSTARIIAKVLNGEDNAQAITRGYSPDVIEIDAASHRKIDDIRGLIAELKFAPIVSPYKIYIIDEVHMLTKEAFNALLKSLEEPPPSTIFILATTEIEKLPKTIVSRCIQIIFSKAKTADLISMLDRIDSAEKLKLSKEAKEFIAQKADGSFRDAAKTLEMAVIQGDTSLGGMKQYLGISTSEQDLLTLIDKKDLKKSLEWIEAAAESGNDFASLIESLMARLHQQLLKKNNIAVELETEYNFTIKEISRLISLLQKAYGQLKYSPIEALPLEVAIVEYVEGGVSI